MDDHFLTAFFPDSATVCGRPLDAFTPYHYMLLRAVGSPFLSGSGVIRPGDILSAVCTCRQTFGKPVRIRAGIRDAVWKLRMTRNPAIFRRECVKFSAWMKSNSSGPRFWSVVSGGQKSRDLTGPDILTLITPLIMKTTLTETEAWNMSLGRAQWIAAEIAELEGSERRFLFDEDLEEEAPNA